MATAAPRSAPRPAPAPQEEPAARPYRWTVEQYHRMIEAGIFPPDTHAELLDGTVYEMSPQGSRHFTTMRKVEAALLEVFPEGRGFDVRVQGPLTVPGGAEPEPDVAVVPGHYTDYADAHPTEAALAVEVSVTSLAVDREMKLPLYAAAGVPEYWIVNLHAGCVEVYRNPSGMEYREKRTLQPGDAIAPLAAPGARIPVADLLP